MGQSWADHLRTVMYMYVWEGTKIMGPKSNHTPEKGSEHGDLKTLQLILTPVALDFCQLWNDKSFNDVVRGKGGNTNTYPFSRMTTG